MVTNQLLITDIQSTSMHGAGWGNWLKYPQFQVVASVKVPFKNEHWVKADAD